MRNLLLTLAVVSTTAACSPYDPDLGASPFLCGPADLNPRCPDGYTCTMMGTSEYCLSSGGTVPVDANNLTCGDDKLLEPNDSYMSAWQTPVASQKMTLTLAGLSICPKDDKDNYAVSITTANQNFELLIEYDPAEGAELFGSILNSGGTPIANASPISGMPGHKRAYTPNLPAGVYYAAVSGPTAMSSLYTNNYKVILNVTGP